MTVFVPVPKWMVSVEVSAPQHMLVLSSPDVIHVVLEVLTKECLGEGVSAGVVYVEDCEIAIGALDLYCSDVISTRYIDDFPRLSVDF